MFMVAVMAGVLVFVFDGFVGVRVFVAATEDEADAAAGDEQSSDLTAADGFAESGPGSGRTDEGCGGEDELSACRAEVSCPGDPQGDGGAVADHADGDGLDRQGRDAPGAESR